MTVITTISVISLASRLRVLARLKRLRHKNILPNSDRIVDIMFLAIGSVDVTGTIVKWDPCSSNDRRISCTDDAWIYAKNSWRGETLFSIGKPVT